ncbi:hypothetical protein, conserved [Eimeria necatrix]|uniref:Uncharacterized protein n=1 Tax=Eimeria necatrix TaxID=51315 RepID=U6MTC7_9EIME|nr:hypothetical protein, conserved [Eimeria necatrix]CDJ67271.1 hypothetical protein, conserved [Eimeria necatrix]
MIPGTGDQAGLNPVPSPYNLRPRNNSQDCGRGHAPSDRAWNFDLFSSALRNARELKDAIDEIVLEQYNKAWKWFLSYEEGEIKNQARVVQHKHEDLDVVWNRMLQELENPGAIMLAMHLMYEDVVRRPLATNDPRDITKMVAKYFREKTVFRIRVDRLKVDIIKKIKIARKLREKGFDPQREVIWNERASIVSKYRRAINQEIKFYNDQIKALHAAIKQREAMIEDFDPAFARAIALISPPDTLQSEWHDEYALMDPEIREKDWDNTVDNFLAFKKKHYMEEKRAELLRDDVAWADFMSMNQATLKKELFRREAALKKLMLTDVFTNIQRAFPEHDPTLIKGIEYDPNESGIESG